MRHLARRRINPYTAGRPPQPRGGFNSHQRARWHDPIDTALDTERALQRLPAEYRILLLLVYGLELSVCEAAWLIATPEWAVRRVLAKADAAFERQCADN